MPKRPKKGTNPQVKQQAAIAYMRTSSAANVGEDKDSDQRQLAAIQRYARRAGFQVVDTYYDAAVSGGDPLESRPGFAAMLERIAGNGVSVILVETANRFARDLMVQEVGHAMLRDLGITLVAVDSPNSFVEDTPTATLIRQVLGAVAQFDKAMTVAKLKGARDRKRATGAKVEGRKSMLERDPVAVKFAKRLAHGNRIEKLSLRKIAAKLAEAGHVAKSGKPFSASVIQRMLNS